jgi:hypothetical protein
MLLLLCWVRPLPAQAADALVQGSLAGSSAGQQRKAKADNKRQRMWAPEHELAFTVTSWIAKVNCKGQKQHMLQEDRKTYQWSANALLLTSCCSSEDPPTCCMPPSKTSEGIEKNNFPGSGATRARLEPVAVAQAVQCVFSCQSAAVLSR